MRYKTSGHTACPHTYLTTTCSESQLKKNDSIPISPVYRIQGLSIDVENHNSCSHPTNTATPFLKGLIVYQPSIPFTYELGRAEAIQVKQVRQQYKTIGYIL